MAEMSIKEMRPAAEPPGRARRGPRGQVIIFGMWCKGCRLCVEFCPTGVLGLDYQEHPMVIRPEKCTACHWCDTHCPDLAIVVKPIEREGLTP
jgi:2-oxoglutarate ferredoxin oxidoreductase subunit delta